MRFASSTGKYNRTGDLTSVDNHSTTGNATVQTYVSHTWSFNMAPDWNENTYARQFESSLRRSPKSRPVAVTMNVSMMDQDTAREVRVFAQRAPNAPLYHLDCGENIDMPTRATVRILGRHYFAW